MCSNKGVVNRMCVSIDIREALCVIVFEFVAYRSKGVDKVETENRVCDLFFFATIRKGDASTHAVNVFPTNTIAPQFVFIVFLWYKASRL